jgi:hypothetical protein
VAIDARSALSCKRPARAPAACRAGGWRRIAPVLAALLMCGLAGCDEAAAPTSTPDAATAAATRASEYPDWPTVTPLPESWQTYFFPPHNLRLRFPGHWRAESPTRFSGPDGFVAWETRPRHDSYAWGVGTACMLEARADYPFAYGWQPRISYTSDWFSPTMPAEMDIHGCAILPSEGRPASPRQAATLVTRLPLAEPEMLLVLRADPAHFADIVGSLRQVAPRAVHEPARQRETPACDRAPGGLPVLTYRQHGVIVTEYAIAEQSCKPFSDFVSFTERVAALEGMLSSERMALHGPAGPPYGIDEANQALARFGYRLAPAGAGRETAYDLYRGGAPIARSVRDFSRVSLNASGTDFLLWVSNSGEHGPPMEVRRGVTRTVEPYERGYDSLWVGDDLLSYEAGGRLAMPPAGYAAWVVHRNGRPVFILPTIPQDFMQSHPVEGFWSWRGQWVMEVAGVLVIDGVVQNSRLGYDEIFEWHLVGGQPMFLFRRGDRYGIRHGEAILPPRYDDVLHGWLCCDYGVYNAQSYARGMTFYGLRDGVWYRVFTRLEGAPAEP